jgi:hypothetical protein
MARRLSVETLLKVFALFLSLYLLYEMPLTLKRSIAAIISHNFFIFIPICGIIAITNKDDIMRSILLEDKSIENFAKALHELGAKSHSIIILSCDENDFTKEALDPILNSTSIPIIGGIFPAIVYKNKQYNQGTILLGLEQSLDITMIENISQTKDYDNIIEESVGILSEETHTMYLFFDGMSNNIDNIIQALFNNYGLTINYVGGSAAGKDFQKKPILFSNKGLLEDTAIIATTSAQSTIGVRHGWEPINDTQHQITKSSGNIIHEIDYKPAFEVYKDAIESYTQKVFNKKDFFETARSFPFGINRLTGDRIVRVAMGTDDNYTLICTGDVNENAYVQILHADNAQLVSAAKEASQLSHNTQYQKSFKLYIGCLARLLVMGEDFYRELDAIYEDEELLVGALSVGEIANNKDHYLELYNSTAVVAKIADV